MPARVLLSLMTCLVLASTGTAAGRRAPQAPDVPLPVSFDALPVNYRQPVADIIRDATLTVESGQDTFHSADNVYRWLVENPDRVSVAWRRLGVPCLHITSRPDGQNRWSDEEDTEVVWRRIAHSERGLIWYAHGRAKLGPLWPIVPGRAVAVLWHTPGVDENGRPVIRHQLQLYIQSDSRAASVVARLVGVAAPTLAKEAAEQLLFFFSGIARYIAAHPEKMGRLLDK